MGEGFLLKNNPVEQNFMILILIKVKICQYFLSVTDLLTRIFKF